MKKTFMYKGKECNEDKKQTRGEMTKETLKNILAKPEYQTIHDLSLIGIDIFDNEGKFKGAEKIKKEISDKINYLINNTCGASEENTKGDEVMTNKNEDIAVQAGREFLKDITRNLIKIKESLTYELGDSTKNGFKDIANFLKRTILKLDICICNLKNIEEDFENKICEINKAIDALREAIKIIETADKTNFLKMDVLTIKDKIENEIEKLKSFDEMFNESENIETTEIDPSVEEDKKENEVSENKKEETSEKDITTPIFKFDDEEMKEKGMYFSGVITPFYGIDFANVNKESVTPFFVNPNVTLTGNKVNNDFEEYAEQSKLNVSEAINKPKVELKGKDLTDEAVLNENIETMRKEIKQIDSCTINVKPMEKAEIITKLSKEIRKCINMKNYIEISNRHRANEDDR